MAIMFALFVIVHFWYNHNNYCLCGNHIWTTQLYLANIFTLKTRSRSEDYNVADYIVWWQFARPTIELKKLWIYLKQFCVVHQWGMHEYAHAHTYDSITWQCHALCILPKNGKTIYCRYIRQTPFLSKFSLCYWIRWQYPTCKYEILSIKLILQNIVWK